MRTLGGDGLKQLRLGALYNSCVSSKDWVRNQASIQQTTRLGQIGEATNRALSYACSGTTWAALAATMTSDVLPLDETSVASVSFKHACACCALLSVLHSLAHQELQTRHRLAYLGAMKSRLRVLFGGSRVRLAIALECLIRLTVMLVDATIDSAV